MNDFRKAVHNPFSWCSRLCSALTFHTIQSDRSKNTLFTPKIELMWGMYFSTHKRSHHNYNYLPLYKKLIKHTNQKQNAIIKFQATMTNIAVQLIIKSQNITTYNNIIFTNNITACYLKSQTIYYNNNIVCSNQVYKNNQIYYNKLNRLPYLTYQDGLSLSYQLEHCPYSIPAKNRAQQQIIQFLLIYWAIYNINKIQKVKSSYQMLVRFYGKQLNKKAKYKRRLRLYLEEEQLQINIQAAHQLNHNFRN